MKRLRWAVVQLVAALFCMSAWAQRAPVELPGASDPTLISRYAGAVLQNVATESYAAVRVPASAGRYGPPGKLGFASSTTVEGKISAYFYVGPKERSALEVFRNYQSALSKSGFTPLYSCEMADCDKALIREPFVGEAVGARAWTSKNSDPRSALSRDLRFASAKLSRAGVETDVMVFVAEPDSVWKAPTTVVIVAEPAPLDDGKVVVNAEALKSGLAHDGRIALYGIYFDTGRADLKPESTAQLEEMARLLSSDPSLKVAIVGHTDTQGAPEVNLSLSQHRAEAVVAALGGRYKIDAHRLQARGVASFAPVASNRSEAGRAKNRRVELVEQ